MKKFLIILILFLNFLISCERKNKIELAEQKVNQDITVSATVDIKEKDKQLFVQRKNSRPQIIEINISPQTPALGDMLHVKTAAVDKDGDIVTVRYQWFKNEILLAEDIDQLSITSEFKRGDTITIYAIPYDGKENGDPAFIKVTIVNSPPVIISSPQDIMIKNRILEYQIKAFDKDGDNLLYILNSGPDGANIDNSGLLRWQIPDGFRGKVNFSILVNDNNGGEAIQIFSVEIGS